MNGARIIAAVLAPAAIVLGGCATAPPLAPTAPAAVHACADLFARVDRAVESAGVRDGLAPRVAGMPWLRVDRTLAGYRDRVDPAGGDSPARAFWIAQLAALDRTARGYELANLSVAALAGFGVNGDRAALAARLDACRDQLVAADARDPIRRAHLREAAQVPDDYSTFQRAIGVYPITSLILANGLARWQRETAATLAGPRGKLPVAGRLVRYAPAALAPLAPGEYATILARVRANPLGIPVVDDALLERLAVHFAPVYEVDVASDDDRIGTPGFDRFGLPAVDPAVATVTVRAGATRVGDRALLQLVYTAWFAARTKAGVFDILGGRFDGLVWRVTLDDDGTPLVYDTIHPCGCYHMFFPGPRAEPVPPPPGPDEFAFVPQRVVPPAAGERLVLRLAAVSHYIENVRADAGAGEIAYRVTPDDGLRSIAHPAGGRASLFGPDGLVAGTERLERFLFWPSGLASAGSMRQWGRHATAFVGRRHFDDPRLIETRFRIDNVPRSPALTPSPSGSP